MKKIILFVTLTAFIGMTDCSSHSVKTRTVHSVSKKKRRKRMTYPVNEPFQVLPDRVVQGSNKIALAVSPTNLISDYTGKKRERTIKTDLSRFPQLSMPDFPMMETLYNMALEEALEDILVKQQAFMAGKRWMGIWTRDISYSIDLALAMILPEISYRSLKAKVNQIPAVIQDTGTGGSWPISTDRVVWALGAWQLYLTTGDLKQLRWIYQVLRNTALADRKVVYDPSDGLYHGESSFMDWREQTYPKWMNPTDIFETKALSTQILHYEILSILARSGKILKEKETKQWLKWAESLKQAINRELWVEEKGIYASYQYSKLMGNVLSDKTDNLGESLAVLSGVAELRQDSLVASIPVVHFGVPCIYPQQPNINPYHNKGIWPFVEAYYARAAAKVYNESAVTFAFDSIIRAAAFFRTHTENMTYHRGHFTGTSVNSERQLWSVAGYLSLVYRILFGIHLTPKGILFEPFVPKKFSGKIFLKNFRYRNALLDIEIRGFGKIKSCLIDGKRAEPFFPADLSGRHQIVLVLDSSLSDRGKIRLVSIKDIAPAEPDVKLSVESKQVLLKWKPVKKAVRYEVFVDGKLVLQTKRSFASFALPSKTRVYFVRAVNEKKIPSNFSRPLLFVPDTRKIVLEVEQWGKAAVKFKGFHGEGYLYLKKENSLELPFVLPRSGKYLLRFRYANGSGPISTDNKCAIRSLQIDQKDRATAVFAQLGSWNRWDFSNPIFLELKKGKHSLSLVWKEKDKNMNAKGINRVAVDSLEFVLVE